MDFNRQTSIPQVSDFLINSSWTPTTPVKPNLEEPQPICTNRNENQTKRTIWSSGHNFSVLNQLDQASWLESEGFSVAACYGLTNVIELNRHFEELEAASAANSQLYRHNVGIPNTFYMDSVESYNEIRFGDLLALADAAPATIPGHAIAQNNSNAVDSSMFCAFNSQIDCNQLMHANEDSGSHFQICSDCALDIPHGTCSVPSRPSFDLNSPPTMVAEAVFSRSISSLFAPITPDQAKRVENIQAYDIPSSITDERNNQATDKLADEVASKRVEANELHQDKEQSQLLKYQSNAAISTQLQENHNPDKEGNQGTESNRTPQQKPRRKKYMPKVVIEGKSKTTRKPMTPKPEGTNEIPRAKRKYIRRKGIDQPTATPTEEATSETADPTTVVHTRKSCRRSLNFDFERQVRDETSSCRPSSNLHRKSHAQNISTKVHSRSTVQLEQGMEVTVEKTQVGFAYDLTRSMNLLVEDYLSMPERQTPSPSTPAKADLPQNKLMVDTQNVRGKCRIVFSNETHDKEARTVDMMTNSYYQSAPRSPNGSNCSSSTCLMDGKQTRGLKRDNLCATDEAELHANARGARYNSVQAYLEMLPASEYNDKIASMFFPTICKKKRTEKTHNSATSSTSSTLTAAENRVGQRTIYPQNDTCPSPFAPATNCRTSDPQTNAIGATTAAVSSAQDKEHALKSAQDKQHTLKCVPALAQTERSTKKRSKCPTRVRDLASLIDICKQLQSSPTRGTSGVLQGYEISHQPHTCLEALVADNHATMATKKRTKRNFLLSSVHPSPHSNIIWEGLYSVDAIVEGFSRLNINAESNQLTGREQNALVPYVMRYRGQNALVLYQRDGTVVPFEGSLVPVKKRRPRAKVDLDDETNRVWKLLLEDINNEGIDGTDVEKAKWWEDERRVFCGRADSFIARMHLVQGDRRFSRWKGSVVDSVVGVFLTQNVSDHLSSSAFMSLAARFPLKSNSNEFPEQAEVGVMDPEDTIGWHEQKSNQPACVQGSMMLHNVENDEEKEVFNCSESFGSSTSCNRSNDISESNFKPSKNDPDMYHESAVNRLTSQIPGTAASCAEDQREREMDNIFSSQESLDSSIAQTPEKIRSCSQCNLEAELAGGSEPNSFDSSTSFVKLLQMAETTTLHGVYTHVSENILSEYGNKQLEGKECDSQELNSGQLDGAKTSSRLIMQSSNYSLHQILDSGAQGVECSDILGEETRFDDIMSKQKEDCTSEQSGFSADSVSQAPVQRIVTVSSQGAPKSINGIDHSGNKLRVEVNKIFPSQKTVVGPNNNVESQTQENNYKVQQVLEVPNFSGDTLNVTESTSIIDSSQKAEHKVVDSNGHLLGSTLDGMYNDSSKAKRGTNAKPKQNAIDWDSLRRQAQANGNKRERTANTMDSVNWEAIRCADVNEVAETIRERGMNNMLAERIKAFLDRIVREHGSIDLEWLRDVPPDKAKEYLLSIRGLGLKSVECVRLLTLHHLAFPVDTNVGRIAVRLGWVPLQPLPESLQLHLLELYPVLESIQKYLWPRLCKLDQRTLYELHYQMITFGKVFCTKSKPNCNACPMRGECRHFASAFTSARLSLPAPEEKTIVSATENKTADQDFEGIITPSWLPLPQANQQPVAETEFSNCNPIIEVPATPEPIIEVPPTPEQEQPQILESDIEDAFYEDPDEIPTIKLNIEEFTQNLQTYMQKNMELQEGDVSKALVALTPEVASIPMAKLKNVSRLRTEHQVYELPDSHPLLEGLDKREPDEPCSYLLAIWTPGETANSVEQPERCCSFQESGKLCDETTCFSCNSIREANSQTVRGTLLIPCRTAMRGSFPLNGTYFQVNEVFADHESSLRPIDVPRAWIWNLPRRTVYFGTSIPTIFKGLSTEGIQYCFWRGFVCVRGFDQKTRAPRPLMARLHFPASKLAKGKGKMDGN